VALLSIRMKQKIGPVGEVLGLDICSVVSFRSLDLRGLLGEPNLVREGDLCGPGYRWTYAQPKFADSDLSCEHG